MVAPKIKGIVGRSRHGQVSADLSFVAALFALPLFFPQVTKQLLGIEVAFAGWGSAYTFLICLTLLMASATSPLASRTLGSRLFIAGGKISYSIYLLHLPIFILLRPVMDTHGTLIYFLACNMTTFAICTLTYFAIEKPARELIRAENASDNAELRQPGSAG
ncbi:MAG: acyltransferase family protein [Hyphomicrobiaceae bacterium]